MDHSEPEPTDTSLFRHSVTIPIRYADIDSQRHLNNVAYFTFLEHARVQYLRDVGLWRGLDFDLMGMVVVEASCVYKAPAFLGETVTARTRISQLGKSSFHFEYRLETERGEIASGRTVHVCYEYARQRSIPMPKEWRAAIVAYEPGF